MPRLLRGAAAALLTLTVAPAAPAEDQPLKYPATHKGDVVDTLHGIKVADPYRWLEVDVRKSKDVADWGEEQNKVTFAYLEKLPLRQAFKERITELWNYERVSAPHRVAGKVFFSRNDGLQNQSVLFVVDRPGAEPRVLIDP